MNSTYVAVAKFQVSQVNRVGYRDVDGKPYTAYIEIEAGPVYAPSGDPDNENWKFAQATPSGSFSLRIDNKDLFDSFYVGQQLYLPMIDADKAALQAVSESLTALEHSLHRFAENIERAAGG